ncbi:MAG: DoxX family membrane protein, partial [Gammaproteobacteria bacterium]|nr:DoxX family membrane protein [Gammaproteobacteria bacterium]
MNPGVPVQSRPASPVAGFLRSVRGAHSAAVRVLGNLVWPPLDLLTRLWLAQAFLVSGILKVADWETAVDLATHEYPVAWLDPVTAAWLGATIELLGGGLLALGFLTRYAAIPLLILTVVIQVSYVALESQLFWMVLFGWYAVAGAGPLSLDHLLRRGLSRTALPLVSWFVRASTLARRAISPVYLSLVRTWLAATLLMVAAGFSPAGEPLATWLPLQTMALVPAVLAMAAGLLLMAGVATRYVAALLLVALPPMAMLDPASSGTGYLLVLLAMLLLHGGGPVSVDGLLERGLARWWPELVSAPAFSSTGLPRVVIIGAGFGGMACANALRSAAAAVTVIDRA